MTPTPAALQAAERFLEIEELHGVNNPRRWAMFAAALKRFDVDEFDVECALEWLEERAAECEA